MRRLLLISVLLAVAATLVGVLATRSGDEPDYRVAAVFDTAKGMVAGQQVKIAGAVVGRVRSIDLAPGPKARMELSVEGRFGPFRSDATCTIRPEGLISENFVECDPGTADAPLGADAADVPVVPLDRTTVPVSLQDVIDVFALPTAERLRVFISELGIAGAGRGEDLDALLRRANPALSSSKRVLDLLETQRAQIADAIGQTDRVLDRLGDRDRDIRRFVVRAADVAETTAARRTSLEQSVQRLPAMLRAVRPGLRSLDRAAQDATPLLDAVRQAGPGLTEVTRTLPAFARAGGPALTSLRAVARTARPAVRRAGPVVEELRRATGKVGVLAPEVDALLVSLRDTGGIEGIMRLAYSLSALTSSYDETSHLINFIANVAPNCIVAEQANVDSPGCAHSWNSPGQGSIPINQPRCGPQRPENLWRNHFCDIPVPLGTFPRSAKGDDGAKAPRRPARKAPAAKAPAAPPPSPGPSGARRPVLPLDLPNLLEVPKVLEGILERGRTDEPTPDPSRSALLDFLLK